MLTMTNAPKITDVLGNPLICHLVNLELERDDFVIFGSAPLLAHGLRQRVSDLDVVARDAAWRRASELGSPAVYLAHGRIQIFSEWISKAWNTDELIDCAEVIQGLRFARLADVLAYKQVLLRPKDMADIHVLPSY